MFGIPRIEPLISKNYTLWSMRVEALIKSKHLFDVIESDEPKKNEGDPDSLKAHKTWLEKKNEVYGIIILTLSAEQTMAVRDIEKAKDLWQFLKKRYAGIENQRIIQLKINLARMEKNKRETIEEYLIRAQGIANEILELDTEIDESELIGFIIEALPKKYSEVTTAISSSPNTVELQLYVT